MVMGKALFGDDGASQSISKALLRGYPMIVNERPGNTLRWLIWDTGNTSRKHWF